MGASSSWLNPATSGKVHVQLSHPLFNQTSMRATDVLGTYAEPVPCFWGGSVPTFLILDLGIVSLNVSNYTLRHGYNYANSFMQDFKLEGSNDGETWETVHEQQKSPFATPHAKASFSIVPISTCTGVGKFFRFFRLLQKGHYWMGANSVQKSAPFLCINGIELYGTARFEENVLVEPPVFAERYAALKSIELQSSQPPQSAPFSSGKGKEKEN